MPSSTAPWAVCFLPGFTISSARALTPPECRVEKDFDQEIIFEQMYKAYSDRPDLEVKDDNPYKAPKKRSKWLRREKVSAR